MNNFNIVFDTDDEAVICTLENDPRIKISFHGLASNLTDRAKQEIAYAALSKYYSESIRLNAGKAGACVVWGDDGNLKEVTEEISLNAVI